MIRPSALTIAEDCDLAPVLAERFPTRSAATDRGGDVDGQATGELAGGPAATDPDARAIVSWVRRELDGRELHVQEAVALYDPDTGGLLTRGTPDIVAEALPISVEVVDIKKREQYLAGRLLEPDRDLQTHAYSLARVQVTKARRYRKCLLLFGDGSVEALWSKWYEAPDWAPVLDRIRAIEMRQVSDPRGTAGPHCVRCYPRLHCPHWTLPAHTGPTELEPLTAPGGLTAENAGRALVATLALEEVAERAKEQLRAFVKEHGPIVVGDRKWGPIRMPGRVGVDTKALEAAGLYEKFSRRGAPFEQYRWGRAI